MTQAPIVARLMFDRERKLKARHRYIRHAVLATERDSGMRKSVTDMVGDPFGGHPYLIQALLQPTANKGENLSLDDASDLLDQYYEKGGTVKELREKLMDVLGSYLRAESTPTEDEEADAAAKDIPPNAASPGQPGRSSD